MVDLGSGVAAQPSLGVAALVHGGDALVYGATGQFLVLVNGMCVLLSRATMMISYSAVDIRSAAVAQPLLRVTALVSQRAHEPLRPTPCRRRRQRHIG